ncbi:2-keto-4-pentenoate hydratase [Microbacterium sp. NPDC055357]
MSGMEAASVAADRLERASRTGIPCDPVRDLLGPDDIDLAYRTQSILTGRRLATGARIVGRKIGLTSPAVQRQIGVDRPDFGVLFDDMQFESGDVIPMRRLLQPKAEAEIAFVLAADITDASDADRVRASVAYALPALEIVDSRIAEWRIGITDTVADNASSGVFALGHERTSLAEASPIDARMSMHRGGEIVSEGDGRACLGDPLNALAWLAATAIDLRAPLQAGDIVLSGALGPMVTVRPGDVFTADISGFGSVTAQFSKGNDE